MTELLLILFFLFSAALYTGMETGAYSINRIRLRFRLRSSPARSDAQTLGTVLADRQVMVATALAGTNISQYLAIACCAIVLTGFGLAHALLWSALILAPVLLVLCEIVPKAFFARHANTLMYPLAAVFRATTLALYPVVMLLKGVMVAVDALFGPAEPQGLGPLSQPRLVHFLEEGRREGVLSPHQHRMARNIMKLEQMRVRDVMVPLERVVAVPRDATVDDLRRVSVERAYSRIPVHEGPKENILGIVGLVEYLCDCAGKPIAGFIRPAQRLNEHMPVNGALLQLRRTRDHMGIVTNDAGAAVGIVTIKDLVEEIVGELAEW
jgi:putative hemolysin